MNRRRLALIGRRRLPVATLLLLLCGVAPAARGADVRHAPAPCAAVQIP